MGRAITTTKTYCGLNSIKIRSRYQLNNISKQNHINKETLDEAEDKPQHGASEPVYRSPVQAILS